MVSNNFKSNSKDESENYKELRFISKRCYFPWKAVGNAELQHLLMYKCNSKRLMLPPKLPQNLKLVPI